MKRMELEIALTFAVMLVISFVINGIYSVLAMNSNFVTFKVMAIALSDALFYLGFIWINTRRHQLLTAIGVLAISFMCLFISFSSEGVAGLFNDWDWKAIVMFIYYMIAVLIATHQGKELLEEDKEMSNATVNLKCYIKIEDEDIE